MQHYKYLKHVVHLNKKQGIAISQKGFWQFVDEPDTQSYSKVDRGTWYWNTVDLVHRICPVIEPQHRNAIICKKLDDNPGLRDHHATQDWRKTLEIILRTQDYYQKITEGINSKEALKQTFQKEYLPQ